MATRCSKWKIWTAAATLAIAACAWLAGGWETAGDQSKPQSPAGPSGGLVFDSLAIQLGEIRASLPFVCQFAFTNKSSEPVEITEARPGCGCLAPRLEQRLLAPGQRGRIALDVRTIGQPAGPHSWQMTILYREGKLHREQTVRVMATVITEVSLQPAALTLYAQGQLSHDITLTDLRAQPLKILSVESSSPHLRATANTLSKNEFGHHTGKISLHIDQALPAGRHLEQIVIHTNDRVYEEFRVPVTVFKDAGQVFPPSLPR